MCCPQIDIKRYYFCFKVKDCTFLHHPKQNSTAGTFKDDSQQVFYCSSDDLIWLVEPGVGLNRYETQAIPLSVLMARKLLLQSFKSEKVPTFDTRLSEIGNILRLVKIQ